MAKLYVGVDMFNVNQTLFIEKEGKVGQAMTTPMNLLNKTIYQLVETEDIEEVFIGGAQEYIEKIGYDILKDLKTNYAEKNVRVRINDKILN